MCANIWTFLIVHLSFKHLFHFKLKINLIFPKKKLTNVVKKKKTALSFVDFAATNTLQKQIMRRIVVP